MISPVYNFLNEIDSTLKKKFEKVDFEKRENEKFYRFTVESDGYEIKMMIAESSVIGLPSTLTWAYPEDPKNENSHKIIRKSTLETLVEDVETIFEKKMFSSNYIDSMQQLITESNNNIDAEPELKRPLINIDEDDRVIEVSESAIVELFDNYGIKSEDVQLENIPDQFDNQTPLYEITMDTSSLEMDGEIKPEKMLLLEGKLRSFEVITGANFFNRGNNFRIEIDLDEAIDEMSHLKEKFESNGWEPKFEEVNLVD